MLWDAPTGRVDAGRVTLAVESPAAPLPDSGALSLAVSARTAPWMDRFFEADDRFATRADLALFPLAHQRVLHEGRRVVEQETAFDRKKGTAQVLDRQQQPVGPAVRMWPYARDAVSALFYARTLIVQPGQPIEFPVFEGGRNLIVTLDPRAEETVTVAGQTWPAVRIDVAIQERVARRRAPDITVWLGRHPPRQLLAAEVRAVFGNLRIELVGAGSS